MTKKIAIVIFTCLAAVAAKAQTLSGGGTLLSEIAPKWHMGFSAESTSEFAIPVDVSDSLDGNVGVYSTGVNVKGQGAWDMKHFLTISADYTYKYYDFSSEDAPFSSMNRTSFTAFYTGNIDENWGVFGTANFKFAAETGGSLWDGKQFSGGAGVTYTFNKALSIGIGALGYSRLDQSWQAYPAIFIDWQITDRLMLRTFTGGALFYDVFGDGKLVLSFSAQYQKQYYRLTKTDDGLNQSVNDGYLQVYVGATYNFTKHAFVGTSIGGNFFRDMQFRTDGRKSGKIDVDSAPTFMVQAGWLF